MENFVGEIRDIFLVSVQVTNLAFICFCKVFVGMLWYSNYD